MNALASIETDRLAKLIRLVFSSDKDGEVVAAVAAAKRLLAAGNVDAHWLADRIAAPAIASPASERGNSEGDDRSAAWFAFHRRHFLSPKERAFICNIVERAAPLTPKQRQWLYDICDSLAEVATT